MNRATSKSSLAVLSLSLRDANDVQQLTPDGVFRARDGRPTTLSGWKLDKTIAQKLLAKLHARESRMVVDYEHQTIHAVKNGQPAPAAGWITPAAIEYRETIGLVAPIQWTPHASAMITAKEYAYLSPVIEFDDQSGEVTNIWNVALTNNPALDGMGSIAALKS